MTFEWNTALVLHGNADSLSTLPRWQCEVSEDQVEDRYSTKTAYVHATEADLALWLPCLICTDQATL